MRLVSLCVRETLVAEHTTLVVRFPSPPGRFSHDSNICSKNVTDGVSYLRYLIQQ